METEKTKNWNWFENLTTECNSLAERFGLDDFHMSELRQFVEQVARDQYRIGSKSGYRWAKQGGDKKLSPAPAAVAA